MSIEHAKAFFKKVATDDGFRSQLQSANSNEERAAAMKAAGYNLTPEESQQLLNQIAEAAAIGSGLSEAELEVVAGGIAGAPGGPWGAGLGAVGGAILAGGEAFVDGDSVGDVAAKSGFGLIGGAKGPS